MPADLDTEYHRIDLLICRRALCDDLQLGLVEFSVGICLDQKAAFDLGHEQPAILSLDGHIGSQQPDVLLGFQMLFSINLVARSNHSLHEVAADLLRGLHVHGSVEPDDAPERAQRVGVVGDPECFGDGRSAGHAGGVRVLYHRHGRLLEVRNDCKRRIEVDHVAVRDLLSVELVGRRHAQWRLVEQILVEGRPLVRVLSVSQVPELLEGQREVLREQLLPTELLAKELGYGGIISCGRPEGFQRQLVARFIRQMGVVVLQLLKYLRIHRRVRDDGHRRVVLRR